MAPPSTEPSLPALAPDRLAACFESLGHLCELGVVQRFCGAEPLGLLRFATLPHAPLLELLRTRFTALDDPARVEVFTRPGETEWFARIAGTGIEYHTGQDAAGLEQAAALRAERQRVRFLKRRLLRQLDAPDRIFLRRDYEVGRAEAEAVAGALAAYGKHRLLWVDHTDAPERIGRVSVLAPGLLHASYGYFWPDAAPSPAGLAVWLHLLDEALALAWPERRTALHRELAHEPALRPPYWFSPDQDSAAAAFEVRPFVDGAPVLRHALRPGAADSLQTVLRCELGGVQADRVYVASAHVWLPPGFAGWVGLRFADRAWIRLWPADARQTGCWQRVVTSARLPNGPARVVLDAAGSVFYSTSWRVEPGAAPLD